MGKGACTFKASDVTRAIEAVRKAKLDIARIEVSKDGTIKIFPGKPDEASGATANEWDEELIK